MKKMGITVCLLMLVLCGCTRKTQMSDDEILQQIRENNQSEKLKERYGSVYLKDERGKDVCSVFDEKNRRVITYFDEKDQISSVTIEEKDFAYRLNEDASFSQFINMKEEADIWEKIASWISKTEFEDIEKTDAFYIVKARVAKEDLDGYLDDVSDVSSVDLNLLVDKTFTVTSFQNETLSYINKEKTILPELEIFYDAKDPMSENEKILTDHIKSISSFRKCTVIYDPKDAEKSTIQYNIASGDESGVLLPDGFHISESRSVTDNEYRNNDVTYYVTDKEEDMEEETIHEAEMSADGVYTDDASGFVSLSEYIPDVILEIRYCSSYNFVGERISGYEEPLALLSLDAAKALKKVSDELAKKGYRLKIYDAYRPQSAVDHFVRWADDLRDIRMKDCFYPDLDKSVLFKQGYIAEKSDHSRGSTVDLTLFDMNTGKELDMGSVFDLFAEISHNDYAQLSDEQLANRKLLKDTMIAYGFLPLDEEWWHFTLKDEPYPNTYFTFPVNSDSLK